MKYKIYNFHHSKNGGQAALVTVVLFLSISLALIFGFTSLAYQETSTTRKQIRAKQSYFLAEAGTEDVVYRIISGKNYSASETLALNGSTAATTVTTNGNEKTVRSSGDVFSSVRNVQTTLETTAEGTAFFYGAQVGYLGLRMENTARVNGSVFSNGSINGDNNPVIDGDAYVALGIGTTPNQQNLPPAIPIDLPIHEEDGKQDGAQGFVPSVTAEPLRVDFYVKKVGNPGDATIKIVPDDGGTPRHNQAAASGQLKNDDVTTSYEWVTMTFNSTDAITQGMPYWIIIDTDSFNDEKYYVFGGSNDSSYANGTFLYTKDWSNASAVWTAPPGGTADIAFKLYLAETQTYIDDIQVGDPLGGGEGDTHAYKVEDVDVAGDVYANVVTGSNDIRGFTYAFDDILPIAPPLSDAKIETWKDEGDAGGICAYSTGNNAVDCPQATGTFELRTNGEFRMENYNRATTTGPMYIPGKLNIKNHATLSLGGVLHVGGDFDAQNNCVIQLNPSYGSNSGVIVVDGTINLKNSCVFLGSHQSESYLFIITTAPDISSPPAIRFQNNVVADVIYASRGRVEIENSPVAKTVYGEEVYIKNSSVLNYEEGLANVTFSEGPGGGYDITAWREVE